MARLTKKQKIQLEALRELIPLAPYADFHAIHEAMRAKHMTSLDIKASAFLATVAHIRHQHTDYDELRDEEYDHGSARHFILEDTNTVLEEWGSARRLSFEADE